MKIGLSKERKVKLKVGARLYGKLTKDLFISNVTSTDTLIVGTAIGLKQGLKYKGDVKRGAIAGTASTCIIGAANTVGTIISQRETIGKHYRKAVALAIAEEELKELESEETK